MIQPMIGIHNSCILERVAGEQFIKALAVGRHKNDGHFVNVQPWGMMLWYLHVAAAIPCLVPAFLHPANVD